MPKFPAKTPAWPAGWVALAALLNCGGWLLSALHQLNATGYLALLVLSIAAFIFWLKVGNGQRSQSPALRRQCRRFRRGLPMAFLLLAVLALVGGIVYPPSNYDALSYRIPRILHWLAAGRWHWVPTIFNRLNTRALGFEWLAAPVIAFTGTDRWLFVINIISFLLLPGLFFSVMTRLGVRPRVAWHWMWLLPTGYCYLTQAASLGNDLFGAVFGLAALDLALRARISKSHAEIWLSALAAALLSGSKLSNLPLLLPWFIAILPSLRLLKTRIFTTAAVTTACVLCSFLPVAAANFQHTRDWTGMKAENNPFNKPNYLLHLGVNAVLLLEQNFQPPIFPFSNQCNEFILKLIPPRLKPVLEDNFERGGAHFVTEEMQVEESAGLGLGICALLLASFAAAGKFSRNGQRSQSPPHPFAAWILAGGVFAIAVFMSKSGLTTIARIGSPYYAFLVPALLMGGGHARIVRARWWRVGAAIVILIAAVLIVVSPARPLWPAQSVLDRMDGHSPLVARAKRVYEVYSHRADCFAPVRQYLPAEAKVIGLLSFDFPETSLWRPFGTRRVEDIDPNESGEYLRNLGIRYILVNDEEYREFFTKPFDDWLAQINGEQLRVIPLDLRSGAPASHWILIRLKE